MFFDRPIVKLLWCMIGAAMAIALALYFSAPPASPLFLASLGGSTIFLFGLTRAAAVQPRALLGGHLGGAAIGIACYQLFGDALWVYALAQALGLVYMMSARVVHPPAGANPILMIYAHAGWSALISPVFIGVASLTVVAIVWSRLYPGLVHYPVSTFEPSPPKIFWGGWDN